MNKIAKDTLSKIFAEAYNSILTPDTIYDSRLMHIVESGEAKNIGEIPALLRSIMCMQLELPLENVWRVEIKGSGRIILNDFTMPSASSKIKKVIKLIDAPEFIRDAIAILQIAPDGTSIEGVGKKIDEDIYYIVEKMSGEQK